VREKSVRRLGKEKQRSVLTGKEKCRRYLKEGPLGKKGRSLLYVLYTNSLLFNYGGGLASCPIKIARIAYSAGGGKKAMFSETENKKNEVPEVEKERLCA